MMKDKSKEILRFVLSFVFSTGILCLYLCVGTQAAQADSPSGRTEAQDRSSLPKKLVGQPIKKESYVNAGLKDLMRIDVHYFAKGRVQGVYVVQPGYSKEASDEHRYKFTGDLIGKKIMVSFDDKKLPYPIAEGGKDDSQGKAVWRVFQNEEKGEAIVVRTYGRNYVKRVWESYDMRFEMIKR